MHLTRSVWSLIGTALVLMGATSAFATELDLNVNDDAARLTVAWDAGSRIQLDASVLTHQDRGEYVHFGAHLVDDAAVEVPLTAGLGGRLVYLSPDDIDDDEFALAVGGFVKYVFPNANRFSVGAHLYYAPDVLGFGDLEEFVELGARASYNVLRDADIYIGARYIRAETDQGPEVTLDNGLLIGVRFRF
ncbi:MAG: YfaZ family outer membrane protein [Pseudomonadota bacterium]